MCKSIAYAACEQKADSAVRARDGPSFEMLNKTSYVWVAWAMNEKILK